MRRREAEELSRPSRLGTPSRPPPTHRVASEDSRFSAFLLLAAPKSRAFFILHSAFFISSTASLFVARNELPRMRTVSVPTSGLCFLYTKQTKEAKGLPASADGVTTRAQAFLAEILAAGERPFSSVGHGTDHRYCSSSPPKPIAASQLWVSCIPGVGLPG